MGVRLESIAKAARDGFTISIGLGVLVYQRAQVHRQELMRTISKVAAEYGDRRNNRPQRD
jgi:hypothetical protein